MAEYINKLAVVDKLTDLENEFQQFKPFEGFEHAMYRKLCEVEMEIGKMPAAETVQRWIPVTERLPDDFSENLCRVIRPIPGGKYVRETRVLLCEYDKSWSCEGLIVTHWMPLPEPPKEVE